MILAKNQMKLIFLVFTVLDIFKLTLQERLKKLSKGEGFRRSHEPSNELHNLNALN